LRSGQRSAQQRLALDAGKLLRHQSERLRMFDATLDFLRSR
jgi:hypothetical protein